VIIRWNMTSHQISSNSGYFCFWHNSHCAISSCIIEEYHCPLEGKIVHKFIIYLLSKCSLILCIFFMFCLFLGSQGNLGLVGRTWTMVGHGKTMVNEMLQP
jgi:hypothetical protein